HHTQFDNTPARQLIGRLLEIAPAGAAAVEYLNSGSEANECALRLVFAYHHRRHNTGRTVVLSEQPNFQGICAEALRVTGMPSSREPWMADWSQMLNGSSCTLSPANTGRIETTGPKRASDRRVPGRRNRRTTAKRWVFRRRTHVARHVAVSS